MRHSRHSLASFLVRSKTDPKMVQALLRHSDVKTTLQLYAHSNEIFGPLASRQLQVIEIYKREPVLGSSQEPDRGWCLHKKLRVESRENQGTTFLVSIPL